MEVNTNTSKPNSTSTPVGLGNAQRPGEYLRQIRLSKGKELSEVAQALKVPEKQLIALEKDEYTSLPEAAFIKGYYRSYAKFLDTDATILIQRFDEIYKNDTGLPPNHALKDSPIKTMGRLSSSGRRGMNKWLKRLIVLVIALIVLWGVWVLIAQWKTHHAVQQQADDTANNSQAVEVLPMNNSVNTKTASGDQLEIMFERPTAVNITDSTGKTLAQGRQTETLNLTGQAPFNIRIDDASAVKLKLDNEVISLSRFTSSTGSADFRLSP